MRLVSTTACFITCAALLAGCGGTWAQREAAPSSNDDSTKNVASYNFAEWCAAWGLTCPTGPAENVPDVNHPWSADQWRGLLATIKAAGTGASTFAITHAELMDGNLDTIATAFGMQDTLDAARRRLDQSTFSSLRLAGGALTVAASEANDYTAPSGLVVHSEASSSVRITDTLSVSLQGMSARGPDGAGDRVDDLAVAGTNIMALTGPNTTVSDAPMRFIFDELVGMEIGPIPSIPPYVEMQPAVLPLANWLRAGVRDLELSADTLRIAAANVPPLIWDPALEQPVRRILGALTSVKSTSVSRRDKLFQNDAMRSFKCTLGTQAEITFETHFGITSIVAMGSDTATVTLYGILAKPLQGSVQPTIRLTRLDLKPHSIVIYNVPIVGTYEIDMSDSSSSSGALTCT